MPVQQLFYKSAVPVSFQNHRDLSVRTGRSYAFARETNAAPVTAIEFGPAAAEYPVVFAEAGEEVFPAAILGARDKQNLFVGPDGEWLGRYVPAFVRRYPFVFSVDEAGKTFTLHIDESYEGANREGRGERLFDADGEQTQYLKGILGFLQEYQARFMRTQAFCRRLVELDLLEPMQAQFDAGTGQRSTLRGFKVVNREKLKALDDGRIVELFRNDELECVYLHLASLSHFRDMGERMRRDGSETAAQPGTAAESEAGTMPEAMAEETVAG